MLKAYVFNPFIDLSRFMIHEKKKMYLRGIVQLKIAVIMLHLSQ